MNNIDEIFLTEEQQQEQNVYSVFVTDAISLTIENMLDINMGNITNRNPNDSIDYLPHDLTSISLTYTFIFGIVCALLCFLTIMGNLLVLITFRRMKTVSISKISYHRSIHMSRLNI